MNLFEYIEKCAKHYHDFIEDIIDESYDGISEYTFWRLASLNADAKTNDIRNPIVDGNCPQNISKLTINSPCGRGHFKWYGVIFSRKSIIVQNYTTEILRLSYDDITADPTEIVLRHGLKSRNVLFTNM